MIPTPLSYVEATLNPKPFLESFRNGPSPRPAGSRALVPAGKASGVQGLGFRDLGVQGLGFRGLGFRVQGLGFRV